MAESNVTLEAKVASLEERITALEVRLSLAVQLTSKIGHDLAVQILTGGTP